jgi:membrane protease YdiL (CAAX protease family)
MTGALALDLASHAATIAAAVVLWLYKDLEQTDVPDRRRSWRMNGILACICALYIWRGDCLPSYHPEPSLGIFVAWGMAAIWIGHAVFCLGLLRTRTAAAAKPRLIPMSLGMTTTALVALVEELLFRGGIQNAVLSSTHGAQGGLYGVFALNLVFGLMHYNRGFTFAMSAGFVGMIFSIATIASGSLLPAIVMHVGWNVLMGVARMRPHVIVQPVG